MLYVGIGGLIDAGKSSAADFLQQKLEEQGKRVQQLHFADALKQKMAELFGFDVNLAYSQEGKKSKHGPSGLLIRQILQEGASRLRALWPGIWVHQWNEIQQSIEEADCDVIIAADVRYPEEMQLLGFKNAPLFYINSNIAWAQREADLAKGGDIAGRWLHESEQHFSIKPELADYVVSNHDRSVQLKHDMWTLFKHDCAKKGIKL